MFLTEAMDHKPPAVGAVLSLDGVELDRAEGSVAIRWHVLERSSCCS